MGIGRGEEGGGDGAETWERDTGWSGGVGVLGKNIRK